MSIGNNTDQDEVLLDYLGTLLQDDAEVQAKSAAHNGDTAEQQQPQLTYPLVGIRARIAEQLILLPVAQLAGMQAVTGPLSPADDVGEWPSWKINPHAELALLDASQALGVSLPNYADGQWRGHVLKLKAQTSALLVDEIMGPHTVHQSTTAGVYWLPANIALLALN